ncbi:MAG TPA: hypothetical protein VEY50_01615 [Lysobacter sp.]|nr:hypothetical protein [Lysobacter sp.]
MKTPLALVPLFAVALLGSGAHAQERRAAVGRDLGDHVDRGGTLSDSVRRVERQTGGEVLSAERVPFEGRDLHRVKVVDANGRVRVYMDDPQERGRGRAEPPARPTRDRDD